MERRLAKLAKKQQQESWNNAKQSHNVIGCIHYANLAVDQSNEIHKHTCWCYFDLHGNTIKMSNNPWTMKKEKTGTTVTIVPAKASLSKINRKVERRYSLWLDIRRLQKQCLKIPAAISKGEYSLASEEDRLQPKTHTDKDIISTTESNNNNNNNNSNTNDDNPGKADDNYIPGPSDYLLFTAAERVVPTQ